MRETIGTAHVRRAFSFSSVLRMRQDVVVLTNAQWTRAKHADHEMLRLTAMINTDLVHTAIEPKDLIHDSFKCRLSCVCWCIVEYSICKSCHITSRETTRTSCRGHESGSDAAIPVTCAYQKQTAQPSMACMLVVSESRAVTGRRTTFSVLWLSLR
jgi:hypothetical protein